VTQAQLKEAAGDLETALDPARTEAKRVYIQTSCLTLRPIAALKARIYLKQGRPDKARRGRRNAGFRWQMKSATCMSSSTSSCHLEIANPLVKRPARTPDASRRRRKSAGQRARHPAGAGAGHEAHGNRSRLSPRWNAPWPLPSRKAMFASLWDEREAMRSLLRLLIDKQSAQSRLSLSDYVDKLPAAYTTGGYAKISYHPSKIRP